MPPARRRAPDTPDTPPAEPDRQQQDGADSGSSETNDLLRELLAAQQEHRAEVASLREELAAAKADRPAPRPVSSVVLTEEERQEQRQKEVAQYQFYCPGCGALYNRERECNGRGEAPHPPIEVVPTKELTDESSDHTAAPSS